MYAGAALACCHVAPFSTTLSATKKEVSVVVTCVQLYSADPLCKGEDWVAINELDDIDIASVHIYAEFWPVCTA